MKFDRYRLHSLPIAILPVLVLFTLPTIAQGQNLVPNGSFEEFYECPNAIGQVDRCIGWSSWANSPDYFNACVEGISFEDSLVDVPMNGFGFQDASDGNGYMGMWVVDPPNTPMDAYREVIGCQLLQPLEEGQLYFLRIKAVLAGDGFYYNFFNMACNNIGFLFSNQNFAWELNPVLISNQAHWFSELIITQDTSWVELSGTFLADSNYTHVGIGNFFDNNNTDYIFVGDSTENLGAYYFLDEVKIYTDSLIGNSSTSNPVEPSVTYFNDQIHIDFVGFFRVQVFALDGKLLFDRTCSKNETISGKSIWPSFIIIRISNENMQYVFKHFNSRSTQ